MDIRIREVKAEINRHLALKGIDLEIKEKNMVGIIGPNGSGKTTLLKTLAGFIPTKIGNISINGQSIKKLSPSQMAKLVSVVSQEREDHFDFTVGEIVMMGRYPYQGLLETETTKDREIVAEAINKTGLTPLKDRRYVDLSGGERQRVMIARSLAQESSLIILDEPTNHLDIFHQLNLFELLKKENKSALIAIHDINFALKYCDTVIVMKDGEIVNKGDAQKVITAQLLKEVFQIEAEIIYHKNTHQPVIVYL
ncbi:ABC transporter ATP-binding protein [Streptococcus moroccensis]|uniref:Iron complex transport system ATP-binding protein n=1 Tax=Streptococcus moroccensis TaxID=1451356 RepID=A0ABT9YS96_9STRE|nr:ABC transporter ATP-binding protein [Streptococcus moroccensis]MDQ0222589.1 iron complex transport system ATP-binding protein [Streptococcus moroccensis]